MSKANVIKWVGSIASFAVGSGALFIHDPQVRDIVLAVAGMALTSLHIPRPGDVKAAP